MGSGASDGSEVMINGGYDGTTGLLYLSDCEKKSFANAAIGVDHSALTNAGPLNDGNIGISADASDGTDCLMAGGYASGGTPTVVKKGFANGSIDESWANLGYANYGAGTASNKANAVFIGGIGSGYRKDVNMLLFADQSTAEVWSDLQIKRNGPSVSSNGGDKIIIAKGHNGSYSTSIEYKAFDTNSSAYASTVMSNSSSSAGHGSGGA